MLPRLRAFIRLHHQRLSPVAGYEARLTEIKANLEAQLPKPIEVMTAEERLDLGTAYLKAGTVDRAVVMLRLVTDEPAATALHSIALCRIADAYRALRDWPAAIAAARAAQVAAQAMGDKGQYAVALNAEAGIYHAQGQLDQARVQYARIFRDTTDARARGLAAANLGTIAAIQQDFASARQWQATAVELLHAAGYERGELIARMNLGRATLDDQEPTTALAIIEQAIDMAYAKDDQFMYATGLLNQAKAHLELGHGEQAETAIGEALGFFQKMGARERCIECYGLVGDIRRAAGDLDSARVAYTRGLTLATQYGAPVEGEEIQRALRALDEAQHPMQVPMAGPDQAERRAADRVETPSVNPAATRSIPATADVARPREMSAREAPSHTAPRTRRSL